jgi:NACalpha-BTF3-like transcription factor
MNKKTIYYIIGGVAILGIGYYLWSKSKKSNEEKEATAETETPKKEEVEPVVDKKAEISAETKKKLKEAVKGNLVKAVKNMPKPATSPAPTTPVSAFEGGLDMDLNY